MDRLFGNKKTPGVPSQMSAAEHEANVAETVTRVKWIKNYGLPIHVFLIDRYKSTRIR